MKRHRDELFAGAMGVMAARDRRQAEPCPQDLMRALCGHLTETGGREVRLMLEPFPPDTVSGLWIDLGDHEVVAVEKNTLPLHQMVILGHELWHRKEAETGRAAAVPGGAGPAGATGGAGAAAAAARLLGDRWSLGEAIAHVAARADHDPDEERRAERFGRLLAAKFLPFLLGTRTSRPPDALVGRMRTALGR
ncbi:toxin-antitoxin system, toxin component [Streptomyces sp. NPDC097619]|uniref:toxin-antitoxin system, toxin component n=1 Tax=Streptomyces sp. NPDC097619 TaxID=3157228 RepID=UPI00331AD59A